MYCTFFSTFSVKWVSGRLLKLVTFVSLCSCISLLFTSSQTFRHSSCLPVTPCTGIQPFRLYTVGQQIQVYLRMKLVEYAAGWQSPVTKSVTGRGQLRDGRVIKPGTYFDAGPELTIEEHCCIRTAILQDTVQQTDTQRQSFTYK